MIGRDEQNVLAGEYALGICDSADAQRAEALMENDQAFARMVADWRKLLAPIDATAKDIAPTPDLWDRIERSTAGLTSKRAARPLALPVWESLRLWRYIGFSGALASLVLAIGLVAVVRGPQPSPVLVAVLSTPENRPAALVHAFADGSVELIPLELISVPVGRVLEIWTLPSRERGPVSVGLMDQAHSIKLNLKGLPSPGAGQLFEITLEPSGGSPVGRPTGPVLVKGLTAQAL